MYVQATLGLLVYRAWKILIRLPTGRAILLSDGEETVETIAPDRLYSFSAVQATLATKIVDDTLCSSFLRWVRLLVPSKVAEHSALSPREKSLLIASVENGHVDWHNSSKK